MVCNNRQHPITIERLEKEIKQLLLTEPDGCKECLNVAEKEKMRTRKVIEQLRTKLAQKEKLIAHLEGRETCLETRLAEFLWREVSEGLPEKVGEIELYNSKTKTKSKMFWADTHTDKDILQRWTHWKPITLPEPGEEDSDNGT